MGMGKPGHFSCACGLVHALLVLAAHPAAGQLNLGPEEIVQAGGIDIDVPGYSVPSFVDWNNDSLPDLVVGEGGGGYTGKVRVYENVGTSSSPAFSSYTYVQSAGADLTCPASGCLGCFSRVVYWDADNRKDLLVGQADGKVKLFLNNGTDANPMFDGGTFLQVGPPGSKTDIDVGSRATATVADWNSDGKKDLVVGELDAVVNVFLNEGTDTAPDFRSLISAKEDGSDLEVPFSRSSPVVLDLDDDGKKDLLSGNTYGHLLFYSNTGTDTEPSFSGYVHVESDGVPIDLAGYRSRPSVVDWTGDGLLDVLIGTSDGKVHLYQGVPEPATLSLLALGGLTLMRRRRVPHPRPAERRD